MSQSAGKYLVNVQSGVFACCEAHRNELVEAKIFAMTYPLFTQKPCYFCEVPDGIDAAKAKDQEVFATQETPEV